MSEQILIKASMDTLTVGNHYSSPLLRIPGEVRNRIYDFVFEDVVHDIKYSRVLLPHEIPEFVKPGSEETPSPYLGLLTSCSSLYKEAQILPFTLPTFKFGTVCDFMRFHANLTYVQRSAIRNVRFEIQGGNPDMDSYVRRHESNVNEVGGHGDRKKQSASKREKQLAKAQRTAAKKEKKGKGKGKGKFEGERNTLKEADEEQTIVALKGAKKSQRSISLLLPALKRVEVVYKFHGAKWYGLPENDETSERLQHNADQPWKKTNRELFGKWLEGDATEKTQIEYVPWIWDHESSRPTVFMRNYDELQAEDEE